MIRAGSLVPFALFLRFTSAQTPAILPAPPRGLSDFFALLRTYARVSEHDLSVTLPSGRPVATLLPVKQAGEVAVSGVERLGVPLEFFLNAFREMPVFKRGQQVLVTHEFSNPPRLEDLQLLTLRPSETSALPNCAPGHCGMKLSAPLMARFHGDAGSAASIQQLFRDVIFRQVTRYSEEGDSAMMGYADKLPAVQSLDEFRALLKEFDWLNEAAPPLYGCLKAFSGGSCPQIDSFIYWSSAKFGLKPVFSVTHVMIYRTSKEGLPWVFVAFKQVYADHYFDGSMGLAVLVQQSADAASPALWVLYINRSLTDALGGWLGPLKRPITQQRSRGALRRNLLNLKSNLGRRYSAVLTRRYGQEERLASKED